jgi:molybdopterin-guanine dinucleotide biosynthesis protein A
MEPILVYILAGGRASRFGSDKARAELRGTPLILHVVEAVRPIAASITVVADVKDKFADLQLRTIADREPGLGPIGGLFTALLDTDAEWIAVVACDLIEVKTARIEQLFAGRGAAKAAAFKSDRWQGALGIYHASCRATVQRQVELGELAIWKLLDKLGATAAEPPTDWPAVPGVNTREELARREVED